jgi:hypothetical protein
MSFVVRGFGAGLGSDVDLTWIWERLMYHLHRLLITLFCDSLAVHFLSRLVSLPSSLVSRRRYQV